MATLERADSANLLDCGSALSAVAGALLVGDGVLGESRAELAVAALCQLSFLNSLLVDYLDRFIINVVFVGLGLLQRLAGRAQRRRLLHHCHLLLHLS